LCPLQTGCCERPPPFIQIDVRRSSSDKQAQYCGAICQKNHWSEHKKTCKSSLRKTNWRPLWDLNGREPAWASGTASRNWHNTYGNNKCLWGNVPAIDVLQLKQNEGHHYHQCLALLFAGKIRSLTFLDLKLTLAWYHSIWRPTECGKNDNRSSK